MSVRSTERRGWMSRAAIAIGGVLGAVVLAPAAAFLTRASRSRRSGPMRVDVCAVSDVAEGKPLRVAVPAGERVDAYAKTRGGVLGAVWLSRAGDGVKGFSSTCPHAACGVDWDEKKRVYQCPCHDSAFSSEGARLGGPAPRGLDAVDVEVKDGRVWVTWKG